MPYIYYLLLFNGIKIQVLLDLNGKINVMTPIFAVKLGFSIRKIYIIAEKIDTLTLKAFRIIMIDFLF